MRALFLASRPKTLVASLGPAALAVSIAVNAPHVRWFLGFTFATSFLLMQIMSNLINDYEDFVRGADQVDRVGPRRAAQSGWLSPDQLRWASLAVGMIGAMGWLSLTWHDGLKWLGVGMVATMGAIGYTAGPYPYAYRGLGEVAVFVFFGVVAVLGAERAFVGGNSVEGFHCAAVSGLGAVTILSANNLRDHLSDKRSEKRTIVVRFGPAWGRSLFLSCWLVVFVAIANLARLTKNPWCLLPALAIPAAARLCVEVIKKQDAELAPVLGRTALASFAANLLLALGLSLHS